MDMAYPMVAARLPKADEKQLKFVMEYERLDKSGAVRKVLEIGLEEWRRREALELLRKGKLTMSAAAQFADIPIWELMELVREKKIAYIRVSKKDIERGRAALRG